MLDDVHRNDLGQFGEAVIGHDITLMSFKEFALLIFFIVVMEISLSKNVIPRKKF